MATGPVKSQPLHNFALPFLKWGGKNQTNGNHRIRRAIGGGGASADHSEPESEADSKPRLRVGSRAARNRLTFSPCSLGEKSAKHCEGEVGDEVVREGEEAEGEEIVQKPWNLRPRKGLSLRGFSDLKNGGDLKEHDGAGASQQGENPHPKSLRLRGFTESDRVEKKEKKRKFWIALSKDEIEEDVFIMTGSRPSRRPKKRPKNVQKQLDIVFPGLWLVGVTADSYRIADSPAKASLDCWGLDYQELGFFCDFAVRYIFMLMLMVIYFYPSFLMFCDFRPFLLHLNGWKQFPVGRFLSLKCLKFLQVLHHFRYGDSPGYLIINFVNVYNAIFSLRHSLDFLAFHFFHFPDTQICMCLSSTTEDSSY